VGAATGVGGQCFRSSSGGNARERTNFGRRPETLIFRPEYIIISFRFSSAEIFSMDIRQNRWKIFF